LINIEATHWFALTERETIVPLGVHKNFNEASDVADGLTHEVIWIFTKESLKYIGLAIKKSLEDL
jgi:hypothetical protein